MSIVSFSCIITLTRTSRTMVNKSGKSGYACFVSDHKGKAFIIKYDMLFFIKALYQIEEVSFYFLFSEYVLSQKGAGVLKIAFYAAIDMIISFLFLY